MRLMMSSRLRIKLRRQLRMRMAEVEERVEGVEKKQKVDAVEVVQ